MDIKEDFDLRENADIVWLAIECAKTLDPTKLKEWFDKKYQGIDNKTNAKIIEQTFVENTKCTLCGSENIKWHLSSTKECNECKHVFRAEELV